MEREEVEEKLIELGWINLNLTAVDTPSDDPIYIIWAKGTPEDMEYGYVGNYYVEVESQDVAYPYKDKDASIPSLCRYLKGLDPKTIDLQKIPTAPEFFLNCMQGHQSIYNKEQRKFIERAVEFTKLHMEAAMKAILEKNTIDLSYEDLLKAYPLENIK